MNVSEALNIFQLKPPVDRVTIKKTYRLLASKYHPDKNKNGLQMMQHVNQARDVLDKAGDYELNRGASSSSYTPPPTDEPKQKPKEDASKQSGRNMWENLGLATATIDGRMYVWGPTYPHKEKLKQHGFRWEPETRRWWKFV